MSNISLYASRPFLGKMKFLVELVNKNLNNNLILFGLQADSTWYLKHIISNEMNTDIKIIDKYLYPCSNHNKNNDYLNNEKIDRIKFIDTLEYLQNSSLIIKDYPNFILEKNNLIDIVSQDIKNNKTNIIIIDRLEELVNYSNKNLDEILSILKDISDKYNIEIIIFNFLKREFEETYEIDSKYIDNYDIIKKYINNIYIIYNNDGNIKEL